MSVDFDVLLAKASSVRKHLDRVTEKCDVSVKAFLKNGPERQQKMPVATQWRSRSSGVYPVAPRDGAGANFTGKIRAKK